MTPETREAKEQASKARFYTFSFSRCTHYVKDRMTGETLGQYPTASSAKLRAAVENKRTRAP